MGGAALLGVDDVHDLRAPERAERQAEVEWRADDDDNVGLLQEPTGAGEGELVIGGEAAAAEAVDERRHPQVLDGGPELVPRAVPPHVAAGDQRRSFGGGDQFGGAPHVVRVGIGTDGDMGVGRVGVGRAEHDVKREVEERGPAVRRKRGGDGGVDFLRDVAGRGDRARRLGDRRHDRYVVELLQRARAPARLGGAAGEDDQRRPVELGGGDGADAVGDAGAGGQHGDARSPRELGHALGGERRRLLVTHVDDADVLLHGAVVDREDVTARQREDLAHAVPGQRRDGQLAAVPLFTHGQPPPETS